MMPPEIPWGVRREQARKFLEGVHDEENGVPTGDPMGNLERTDKKFPKIHLNLTRVVAASNLQKNAVTSKSH